MIAPHTSCRYAVVYADAFEPGAEGYAIAAVHALNPTTDPAPTLLLSRVSHPASSLAFGQPQWVPVAKALFLAANFKDASNLRVSLVEQDHRAEGFKRPCSNDPGHHSASFSPRPGVFLCNDCAVDAQRDEFNRDEAIR